jgi:hypothetical protein
MWWMNFATKVTGLTPLVNVVNDFATKIPGLTPLIGRFLGLTLILLEDPSM